MAEQGRRSDVPVHDGICFHCQQCAEKYLKAMMEEAGLSIPKTHDLEVLLDDLKHYHPTLSQFRRGLVFLTDYAVNARYPGENATKRQAVAARKWADRVRLAARKILNIRARSTQ